MLQAADTDLFNPLDTLKLTIVSVKKPVVKVRVKVS